MIRVRRWSGRAVVIAAALASIATKRPMWTIEPPWPAGTPHTTGVGNQGLLVTLTATAKPIVECAVSGSHYQLEPLPGTTDRYLCPPGGTITQVILAGNSGGGCGKPEPPSDQSIHIDRVEVVDTWMIAATARVHTTDDGYSRSGWARPVTAYQTFATTTAGTAAVYGNEVRVDLDRTAAADVDVDIAIFGPCSGKPCTPPADAKLELP